MVIGWMILEWPWIPSLFGSFLPNNLRDPRFFIIHISHPCINSNQRPWVPTTFPSVGILVSNLDLIHRHWHQVYLNQTVVQSNIHEPSAHIEAFSSIYLSSTVPGRCYKTSTLRKAIGFTGTKSNRIFLPKSDSNSNLSSPESKVPFLPKEALFPQLPSSGLKP